MGGSGGVTDRLQGRGASHDSCMAGPEFSMFRNYVCLLLVALLLSACAAPPVVPGTKRLAYWDARRILLSKLKSWKLSGRIGIELPKEAWSASLRWTQDHDNYQLRLIAPFGRGTYELRGGNGQVVLQTPKNKVYSAPSAEALLQRNLGWQVPVSGLRYWVRGLPEPGQRPRTVVLDDHGRVSNLEQDGFKVRYEQYQTVQGYDLPRRITLDNSKIRVKLLINSWSVPS